MPDPYSTPEELWNEDGTKWPSIEFCEVSYAYLIETRGHFTKDKLKAHKLLEVYNSFYNGYARTDRVYCTCRLWLDGLKLLSTTLPPCTSVRLPDSLPVWV